ncbi:hypothetical protein B0E45_06705 [Sinorhizobium sp. A49]|nr:hypothetical protein B0E45_06705 [Sinorhizobium sp. A49]
MFEMLCIPLSLLLALVAGIQRLGVIRVKSLFSPKTWADWFPVTGTGMRRVWLSFVSSASGPLVAAV